MLYNLCFSPTDSTQKVADILVNALAAESTLVGLCANRRENELFL